MGMKDNIMQIIGYWAYVIAFLGAIILGSIKDMAWMPELTWLPWVLVVLGVIIGILNITEEEEISIILAALTIGLGATYFALVPTFGGILANIMGYIAEVTVPIAIVVGLKIAYQKAS